MEDYGVIMSRLTEMRIAASHHQTEAILSDFTECCLINR